jgi:hypothetical protein
VDLIRQCEAQFLVPAAVPGSSDVFRLFRPASLHLNLYPTEPWLKTEMTNMRIAPTDMAQSLPVTQTVSTPETAPMPSSVPADVTAPAFKPPRILPEISALHAARATPAEQLSGISCFFRAGGEVRRCMVEIVFYLKPLPAAVLLSSHLLHVDLLFSATK